MNSKRHIDQNISQQLFYYKCTGMLYISSHFGPLKPLTFRMDHAKILYALTSLPVSHAILPSAMCFATSLPANHATCSYISQMDRHLSQSEDVYL